VHRGCAGVEATDEYVAGELAWVDVGDRAVQELGEGALAAAGGADDEAELARLETRRSAGSGVPA